MRKVFIIVTIAVLALFVAAMAFAGGIVVGRMTTSTAATPIIVTAEPLPPDSEATPAPTTGDQGDAGTATEGNFDYAILTEVLNLIESDFYGEIPDPHTLAYGAIQGMLNTLDDPYTSFMDPNVARVVNEDATGQFEGIGAYVRMREDGYLEVASPMPGQPAEAAGVRAGDLILTVDDVNIVGMGLYEAINLIRGPAGSEVTLEIAREGEPELLYFTIVRARVEIPVVEYEMLEDNVAYIHLLDFDATAMTLVQEALQELLAENPRALIFDLRSNPGGYLNQAIGVADLFLGQGVVLIERDSEGSERTFRSYDGDLGEDIPMVVLINGGSASASEIVAGALQDRGRAVLIGDPSFGKGSVQLPYNLSDGSQLRVTIARWYTPNDTAIHGEGLSPDIEAPFPADTPEGEDPQIQRALDYILQGE